MNKDLVIAKKHLHEHDKTLVIVKDEEVIYESSARGIKPIYEFYLNYRDQLAGGSLADKVFGKAAAIISTHLALDSIYSYTISEEALEILTNEQVNVHYELVTEKILNRTQEDLCPVEKLSRDYKNFDDLLNKIRLFLESINN
jgi:hypothetical protein